MRKLWCAPMLEELSIHETACWTPADWYKPQKPQKPHNQHNKPFVPPFLPPWPPCPPFGGNSTLGGGNTDDDTELLS